MVFNSDKNFFLTLDDSAVPAKIDLLERQVDDADTETIQEISSPAPTLKVARSDQDPPTEPILDTRATAQVAPSPEAPANDVMRTLTTAEVVAAELAAAEAARPEVVYTTYAPNNLFPGNGLRQGKRRPGAAIKNFRTIAADLFKS
ncbi:hypothetical protein [Synechococcus sp. M16CYN]|uniref:hypothetical protein n=1 Tax=Synechococcus sp. M16CYN TaxID=3103139 RepID=UPI00324F9E04